MHIFKTNCQLLHEKICQVPFHANYGRIQPEILLLFQTFHNIEITHNLHGHFNLTQMLKHLYKINIGNYYRYLVLITSKARIILPEIRNLVPQNNFLNSTEQVSLLTFHSDCRKISELLKNQNKQVDLIIKL